MAQSRRMRNLLQEIGPHAILLGALLVGFSGLVWNPRALIVDGERPWRDEGFAATPRPIGNDLTGLFLPRFLWQSEEWRQSARIPRWDPRGFAGRPNVGNPQAGLWYPPVWIAWAWGSPASLGWLTVAHLYWSGIGAFALGRKIGLGMSAATASGAILMLNPYGIAQVQEGHLPHVWAASWYPWTFLGASLIRQGSGIGWVVLCPSLALATMTGHPQAGAYLAITLMGWPVIDGIRFLARDRTRRNRTSLRRLGRWGIAFILVAGLSAVEWVPVLAVMPWAVGSFDGAGGGSAGPYHLFPSNLFQLISPRALGGPAEYFGRGNQWESMLSIGWAPLVMAVVGAVNTPNFREARKWLLLVGLSLWFASGPALGLSTLVQKLPGMGAVRVPSRSLFLTMMATSMLSGMGIDVFKRIIDRGQAIRWARHYGLTVGLLVLIVSVGLAMGSFREENRAICPIDRWSLASARITQDQLTLLSLLSVGIFLLVRSAGINLNSRMVTGIVIGELSLSAVMTLPLSQPNQFLAEDPVSEAIYRTQPDGVFRVRARDAFYSDLDAWRDGVEKVNIADRFQPRASAEIVRTLYPLFDDPTVRPLDHRLAQAVLDRMGCARIISDRPLRMRVGPVIASGIRDGHRFAIIANETALPRAWVVPRAKVVTSSRMLEQLADVDPLTSVLMTTDPLRGVESSRRQVFTEVDYLQEHPDRVRVQITTEAPGLLVIADTWMPGWSATVNGQHTPIFLGDHAFRVIPLPEPGQNDVLLTYKAPGLLVGSAVTLGSGITLMLIWLRSSLRERRARWD